MPEHLSIFSAPMAKSLAVGTPTRIVMGDVGLSPFQSGMKQISGTSRFRFSNEEILTAELQVKYRMYLVKATPQKQVKYRVMYDEGTTYWLNTLGGTLMHGLGEGQETQGEGRSQGNQITRVVWARVS